MTNEAITMWMLGSAVTFISADVVAYIALKDKINDFNMNLVQRVTKLEAFIELLGQKTARMLHSPDDHLGLDQLLDKYLDRNYELTIDEWRQGIARCEEVEMNKNLPMGARLA